MNSAKLIFASALALLANVYIPGWLLGFFGVADAGLFAYFVAAVVVFGPAYALNRYPMFAKGWLAGGGAGFVWRIVDDLTSNKYLNLSPGAGLSSFIVPGQNVVLPGQNQFAPYARGGPALLGSGSPVAQAASPVAVGAAAKPGGVGWFYS
jgi:hypothetical protein